MTKQSTMVVLPQSTSKIPFQDQEKIEMTNNFLVINFKQ